MAADNSGVQFVWYDLMTPDKGAAVDFYTEIMGWGTTDWDGPFDYTMWTVGEAPVGGIVVMGEAEKEKGLPPHWIAYVGVPDVDAAAAKAEQLGGQVMHPATDIPGAGRFTVIADPQGAVLALYTPADPSPNPEGPPGVGRFSWHELMTTDHDAAFEFYSAMFGWQTHQAMDMGQGNIYRIYGLGGVPLGGMFTTTPEMDMPPTWLYYVSVADLDAAVDKVKAHGGQIANGPMDVPGGDRIVQCTDPHGAFFALHWSSASREG